MTLETWKRKSEFCRACSERRGADGGRATYILCCGLLCLVNFAVMQIYYYRYS